MFCLTSNFELLTLTAARRSLPLNVFVEIEDCFTFSIFGTFFRIEVEVLCWGLFSVGKFEVIEEDFIIVGV